MTRLRDKSDRDGFTLIEVIGALVVFSVGVLIVIQLSGATSLQLNDSAMRSAVMIAVQTRVDSLSTIPYDSLTVGSEEDTLTIRGISYLRTVDVTQYHPLMREITVTVEPVVADEGPDHTASTFVVQNW